MSDFCAYSFHKVPQTKIRILVKMMIKKSCKNNLVGMIFKKVAKMSQIGPGRVLNFVDQPFLDRPFFNL